MWYNCRRKWRQAWEVAILSAMFGCHTSSCLSSLSDDVQSGDLLTPQSLSSPSSTLLLLASSFLSSAVFVLITFLTPRFAFLGPSRLHRLPVLSLISSCGSNFLLLLPSILPPLPPSSIRNLQETRTDGGGCRPGSPLIQSGVFIGSTRTFDLMFCIT